METAAQLRRLAFLAVLLVAAAGMRAGETCSYSDPAEDTLITTAVSAYDLESITVERKSSNVLRFSIPLRDELPKKPKHGSGWKVFLDLDNNSDTGDAFVKGIGVDVYVVVEYDETRGRWNSSVIPRVPELESRPFSIRHLSVKKDEVKIEVQSPALISRECWKFFVEAWDGNQCADRMPGEGGFAFPPEEQPHE